MKENKQRIETAKIPVEIIARSGRKYSGNLHLHQNHRVSDMMKLHKEPFLNITEVTMIVNGVEVAVFGCILMNKDQIEIIYET